MVPQNESVALGIGKPLPSLTGTLTSKHESRDTGGGGEIKEFASAADVRDVFKRGISQLRVGLSESQNKYAAGAVIAMIKLRSKAIAKSHRHQNLVGRLQIVGVEKPGEILALVTPSNLDALSTFLNQATRNQLKQLSTVEEITPYRPQVQVGEARTIIAFFEGTLDDGRRLRELGFDTLLKQGIQLKPYGKLRSHCVTHSKPLKQTLMTMPWIRKVRPSLRMHSLARIGTNPIGAMSMPASISSLPVPIIGIVDSGIDCSESWLNQLVVDRQSHIPDTYSDKNHGTLVGALAASGGGFNSDPVAFPAPVSRLLDVQILGAPPYDEIDEADLLIQLENAVRTYGSSSSSRPSQVDECVRIWNLSLGAKSPCDTSDFSSLAQEIDRISSENKVMFTIAAGNYNIDPLRGWDHQNGPDVIANGNDRISSPGDSALAIVVGSLSDSSNPPSASPADFPSPFSRRGPSPGMLIKPDVVHYGGTCDRQGKYSGFGIQGPAAGGRWQSKIGTSFAAPRVAAELAKLVSRLPDPEPELLKLITLLACEIKGAHTLERRDMVNYYGFGVVTDTISILGCDPWECILFLHGELRPGYPQTTDFPFANSLIENKLRRGHVRMALVYTPVLDPDKGAEYCQTNVSASLGRLFADPKGGTPRYNREVPPIPVEQSVSHQFERDLIEHGWKWSPTKVYERKFHRMSIDPREIGWRLSVELLLRKEIELIRENIRQPFWLGIRLSDPNKKANVYQEMQQQLSLMGLAQPIQLRPQIQIRP